MMSSEQGTTGSALEAGHRVFVARIPAGYKRTEVGVIPDDWERSSVRAIASSTRNAIVGGPFGSDLVSKDYVAQGIPVIRGQNMSGQWVSGSFVFVTPTKAKSLEANLAHPGDIIFTQRGTLGQVSLVPDKPFSTYLVSQSQMKLSVNRTVADPLFLFYFFTSYEQQKSIQGRTIQTGVPHINLGILREMPVRLPPLAEQRAIAEALSDVDGLLAALEVLIAKKRAIKQAAMQQLLTGKSRLPGFSGAWKTTRLGDLGAFSKGRGIKRDDVSDTGLPCIRYGELYTRYKDYILNPVSRIPSAVALEALPIKKGDLLFAGSGETAEEIGICAAYLGEEPAYAGGDVIILTPSGQDSIYLGHLMNHPTVATQKARMGQGDAVVHISASNLAQVSIELPPLTEQTAIANILSDMDAEIAALERRRDKTRAVKQGMIQQLLTGRIRLVKSESLLSHKSKRVV